MHLNLIQIGNSKGIRIPKAILEQCHIESEIVLHIQDGKIILEPRRTKPREGWEYAFKQMAENGDDSSYIDENIDIDMEDWQW